MSPVGGSPLSSSSPDSVMQAPTGLDSSVGCLHHFFLAFVYDLQTGDSGLGLFKARNILINGGTFVSHGRWLHISISSNLYFFSLD